jgi:hypothetical protein
MQNIKSHCIICCTLMCAVLRLVLLRSCAQPLLVQQPTLFIATAAAAAGGSSSMAGTPTVYGVPCAVEPCTIQSASYAQTATLQGSRESWQGCWCECADTYCVLQACHRAEWGR